MSRPPRSESQLVARARAGDADAYAELVRTHQQIAFRTAALCSASLADAEEAAQDGFVKAWRALAHFDPARPFRPWVLAIVANEARNRRRAAGARDGLARRLAAQAGTPGPSPSRRSSPACGTPAAPTPLEALLAAERDAGLAAALRGLDERDRRVVVCRHLLGLSEAETAAVLGCRPGTVKSRLSRALTRLRAALADEEAVRA